MIKTNLRSSLPMESVVALIAEWISLGEMIKIQELSALISDHLKEWQDKETLDLIGELGVGQHDRRVGRVYVWGRHQYCLMNVDVPDLP